MKTIYASIKNKKICILLILLGIISHSFFALGMAGYSKYVFDSIAAGKVDVRNIVVIGFGITLWGALSIILMNWSTDYFISGVIRDLRNKYVSKVIDLPVMKINELGEGKVITNYTQDIGAVTSLVRSVISIIKIPFEMFIASVYLFYQNWLLALIVLLLLPFIIFVGKYIGKFIQKINEQYLSEHDEILKLLTRIFRGSSIIKTYMIQDYMQGTLETCTSHQFDLDQKRAKYNALFSGITDFFMGVPFIIVYIMCAVLFIVENITVGTLTMFLQLLNKITVPFVSYSRVLMQYKESKVSLERLNEIYENNESEKRKENRSFEEVEFKNVDFSYKNELVLKNINVLLENGKYYGVIGENGSGKSTFIKLLLNLYEPIKGEIYFSPSSTKNNKLIYVEDKPSILFDNIIDNILVGSEKNEKKVMEVLKSTGLQDQEIIELLHKKTEELSAGLLQRVSLARGLYHLGENDILVLDEAFAALDVSVIPKIRKEIQSYQEKLNLTIIEITHNMSNLERFDEIIFFQKGEILLKGSDKELSSVHTYHDFISSL